ncbi:MAG: hypothetical protein JWQ27_2243 [Ferruginibacter sp.]|nr:hypothetical protein [Ferruginibacter sp.]
MGELMRLKDWSASTVGEPSTWPAVLRTTVSLILNSKFPMFIFWGKEAICFYNDAYRPSLGNDGKHPSILGEKGADAWPEIWPDISPMLNDIMAGGEAYWNENWLLPIFRNGSLEDVYWTFSYSPINEETGETLGILVTCVETTAAVNQLAKAENTRQDFYNIMMQAPVGITVLRGENMIVEMANEAYLHLIGKEEKDFVGKSLYEGLPEVRDTIDSLLQRVLKTGIPVNGNEFEVPLNRFGKIEKAYFNFVYHPFRDQNGDLNRVMVVANEVTSLIISRNYTKDAEERLRLAAEGTDLATWDLNLQNPSIIHSPRLAKIFGRDELDVMTHQQLRDAVEPNDRINIVEPAFARALETGIYNYEARIIHPDQQEHWIKTEGRVIFDEDKKPLRMLGTIRDITEDKRRRELAEQDREKLNIIIEASELGVYEWDIPNDKLEYSARYAAIFGRPGLMTENHQVFVESMQPEMLPIRAEAFKVAFETGRLDYELKILWPDGSPHWIQVKGKLFYQDEEPRKLIGTIRDITTAKLQQQQIEESEKRFKIVADTAPVFIWVATRDQNRIFFNKAWLKFRGRTLEQETGTGWKEGLHPDDYEKFIRAQDEGFKNKTEFHLEYRLKRHDGEYIWVSAHAAPRFTPEGIFEGFIGACMNINDRIIFENKLRESESRLRIAALSSELGTWDYNARTKVFTLDSAGKELLGFHPHEEVNEASIRSKIHQEDQHLLMAQMEQVFTPAMGSVYDAEYRIISGEEDEQPRWIHAKGKALYDEEQQAHRFSGTILDITAKKIALLELQENEKRYRFLADAMPQFVWTGGPDGNLNYFNKAVYEYSGLTAEQFTEHGWLQIVHPDDHEENISRWTNAVVTGQPFLLEHRFRRHDGVYRWQLSRAVPQKDAEGNIRMWVGTSTDIDEIKKHEQQKNDFIKMANHELKTPVTTIKGYVQLLLKANASSTDMLLMSSLQTVDKQISKLTNLISDLLDVTKIEIGRLPLNKEIFNLNGLISDTILDMRAAAQTHTIYFEPLAETLVFADRDRMSQVLLNLFTNAFKYSPRADKVNVSITIQGEEVVVGVQDFGIGIASGDQDKIFERFYRVSGKDEKTFPGFGIGLFIVNEIVLLHNGKLWVESEKDQGSTFYFSLPLSK